MTNNNNTYNVDYFIRKFEAIPEDRWATGSKGVFPNDENRFCAYGHCGVRMNGSSIGKEAIALSNLLSRYDDKPFYVRLTWGVVVVNDNTGKRVFKLDSPKARILAALQDIKKMQSPSPEVKPTPIIKEKIKYVSVPTTISEQAKELILS